MNRRDAHSAGEQSRRDLLRGPSRTFASFAVKANLALTWDCSHAGAPACPPQAVCRSARRTACAICTWAATRSRAACASAHPRSWCCPIPAACWRSSCSCPSRNASSTSAWAAARWPSGSTSICGTVEQVVLEIDPRVIAVARQYFCLPPDDRRLRVIEGDGARLACDPGGLRGCRSGGRLRRARAGGRAAAASISTATRRGRCAATACWW